eukprot:g32687.t1
MIFEAFYVSVRFTQQLPVQLGGSHAWVAGSSIAADGGLEWLQDAVEVKRLAPHRVQLPLGSVLRLGGLKSCAQRLRGLEGRRARLRQVLPDGRYAVEPWHVFSSFPLFVWVPFCTFLTLLKAMFAAGLQPSSLICTRRFTKEATYLETCAVVAVKRVTHDLDDRLQKECETEITILQMLDHPNLIKYHTHFTFHGDLQEKLIEEHLVWRWLNDVSSALAYLHKRRVLHRDVKPSHIFIGETGQAKLGDFGLSKAFSDATTCAMSCVGTPLYMSPEIVRGEGYSFGSDIWSLGCSLYELAAGLPPFYRTDAWHNVVPPRQIIVCKMCEDVEDMDFVALGHAICSAEYPELPSDVWSKEFLSIVSQILTVDPTQRPSAQMIFDLAGLHRALWKAGGDREVALKRIQIDEMNDHARREVYAEAKILQELSHATIIKYFDACQHTLPVGCVLQFVPCPQDSFTEDNEMVIILELAAHGDLSSLLSKQKHMDRLLEEHQVWGIFFQIGEALHHMHRQRIMHRDIKPENTFICHRGVVKLGDLGLGRFFGSNTYKAHSVVGTPFYMSPEVISAACLHQHSRQLA